MAISVFPRNGRALHISASNFDTGKVYAVDTATGNQTWAHTMNSPFAPPVLSPDSKTLFAVGFNITSRTNIRGTLQALRMAKMGF